MNNLLREKQLPTPEVVMASAYISKKQLGMLEIQGVKKYYEKPIKSNELRKLLKRHDFIE